MSSSSSSRNKAIAAGVVGAVGAGALIGLGFLLYQQIEGRKKDKALEELLTRKSNGIASSSNRDSIRRKEIQESSSQSIGRRNSVVRTTNEIGSTLDSDEDEIFEDCFSDFSPSEGDEEQLFSEVDQLMKGSDRERLEAFKKLEEVSEKMSTNVEFLWKFAKAHQMQAAHWGAKKNLEKKKQFIVKGLEYAKQALSLDENSADAHKWFAILTGMYVDFLSVKEKIQSGYIFQKHVQLAIDLKPKDHSLYYLLGRFKFEVANTSYFEKKMAATLFGKLPNVTYKDAIKDLKEAERLNPVAWKENRLLLAKCHLMDRNYTSARRWLDLAKDAPVNTDEDAAFDREIDSIRNQYKSYF